MGCRNSSRGRLHQARATAHATESNRQKEFVSNGEQARAEKKREGIISAILYVKGRRDALAGEETKLTRRRSWRGDEADEETKLTRRRGPFGTGYTGETTCLQDRRDAGRF